MSPWLRAGPGWVELDVVVVPRSSKTKIAGVHGDRLKVQLEAPPVDGEANAALIELLAERSGVARRAVTLVRGQTGRRKTVRLEGVSVEAIEGLVGG